MRFLIVENDGQIEKTIENTVKDVCPESVLAGTADNGRTGYELIRRKRPDLVIMDLKLPGMSGLTMLKKMRAEKIDARVIILTSDTDFEDIRQAVSQGIDNYMLKPVKTSQLKGAVLQAADKLKERRTLEKMFTLGNIFTACLNGQLQPDQDFHQMTREKFGFTLKDPGALFVVWIRNGYAEQKEQVRGILERAGEGKGFAVCPVCIDIWQLVAAVVYRTPYGGKRQESVPVEMGFEQEYTVFRDYIAPALSGSIRGEAACMWEEAERMEDFRDSLRNLRQIREWNLLFDRGDVIRRADVEALDIVPLKYPAALEAQVRQAVIAAKGEEIKKCYYRLYDVFREEPHSPRELKECLIRFDMAVLAAYKTQYEVESELSVQYSMQMIADAISWGQIRTAMEAFFGVLNFDAFEEEGDKELSVLIRKAVQLVRKYYDQGITLEEIAAQLFVSEEYLSAQFKKETGTGFSETVRNLRIERIKGLLVGTRLKLNQIAELTGYTDPKYMSKVFKDEVGMLPTEFRKAAR